MASLPLSDGTTLTIPDDATDAQAQSYYDQAEAAIKAEAGTGPMPVEEDQPGWDWLRNKMPGVFNTGHEFFTGVAQGVGDLPNAFPNVVNGIKSLNDLHFGSGTGEVAPENQWPPWMDDEKGVFFSTPGDKTLEELNPQTPGYEQVRRAGQISGSAAPLLPFAAAGAVPAVAGISAMAGAPVLATTGRYIGMGADALLDEPNAKWERTGEALLPAVTGLGKLGRGGLTRLGVPIPKKINATTIPAVSAAVGSIAPETALAAGTAVKAADFATRGSKGVVPDIAGLLARSLAPLANDDPRWAR